MALAIRVGTACALITAAACAKKQPPPRATPAAVSSHPTLFDSVFAEARRRVQADTTSLANRQLNLMSAPIIPMPIAASAGDSLLWTAPPDSCALLVVSKQRGSTADEPRNGTFFAAEWYGNGGFGYVSDIAPAPNWAWMAYGHRSPPTGASEGSATVAPGAAVPVVENLADPCAGDNCELETVSNVPTGWRVGWTPDGIALFAGRELPPRWIAVDPATRAPIAHNADSAISVAWSRGAVTDFVRPTLEMRAPGGAYTFFAQHDSIVVRGPDPQGVASARFVGRGVPIISTRNGEYLLAVRQGSHGLEAIVYYFQLHHAMMRSTCDR